MYSNAILKLVPCKNKAVCATWRVLKHVFCCAELLYPTDWMLTYSTFFFPGGCLELNFWLMFNITCSPKYKMQYVKRAMVFSLCIVYNKLTSSVFSIYWSGPLINHQLNIFQPFINHQTTIHPVSWGPVYRVFGRVLWPMAPIFKG